MLEVGKSLPVPGPSEDSHRKFSSVGTLCSRLHSLVYCRSCSSYTEAAGTLDSRHSWFPPSGTACSVVHTCRGNFCSHYSIRSCAAGSGDRRTRTGPSCRCHNTLCRSPLVCHTLYSSCRPLGTYCMRCSSYTSCRSWILHSLGNKCKLHAHLGILFLDRSCRDV